MERHRKSSSSPNRSKSKFISKQGGNKDNFRDTYRSRSPISRGPNRRSYSSDRQDHSPDRRRDRDYEKISSKERKHGSKADGKHFRDRY